MYFEEDDERNCLDIIEEEFVKRYPITARRHDLIQLKQQRGQLLTTFINNLMMLGSEADMWELKPEDWMVNLAIAGIVDEEAMKIENPNMAKIRQPIHTKRNPTVPSYAPICQGHIRSRTPEART